MGLSALSFIAAAGLIALLVVVLRRGQTQASRFAAAIVGLLALFSILEGVLLLLGLVSDRPSVYIFLLRTANLCLAGADLLLLAFALSFPRWLSGWVKLLPWFLAALLLGFAYLDYASPLYIFGARFDNSGFTPVAGDFFFWVNLGTALLGLGAATVHLVRGLKTDDRINRQRSLLAFTGVVLGVVVLWALQYRSMAAPADPWPKSAAPFAALVMCGIVAYGMALSRLFDWRELFRTFFAYAAITLVVGVPAGLVLALLLLLGSTSPLIPFAGSILLFLVASRMARGFAARFFERTGSRHEYREMLESSLAHVDLAQGRDAVLADLNALLAETFGFSDFTILIEDDRGVLKTAYASSGAHATMDRSDALRTHIEKMNVNVLMLSEAQADSAYETVQKELLAFFGAVKAEALIFAREGHRIIGIFALGARKIGGEYTDYDYDTFKAICGKLFVFAFYLKNIARESILYTVDRELALSDQIIRFALEHVAPVDHPKADTAWAMKSTRSLGGDFVDFVKMGKERYFFVLGDVSGKGLSASMNMLILKSMVRTFLRIEKDFAGLVQRVNAFIKDYLPRGSFFAGVFGYFDFERGIVYFINCGVPAILLYSPNFDAFIEVQGEGKVLGFVRDVRPYLKPRKLSLSPGTALVVCTDGLLDSENIRGERFGKERLRKASRDRLGEDAKTMADGVLGDLLKFTENRQEDDITLLVMKIKQGGAQ
jgi:hypothetical protein